MSRNFFKRHIPNPDELHKHCSLIGRLGEHLHRPSLWHMNRRSIAKAFAIGLFCTWLPMPFQTALATFLAILFYANLPLSIVLVFISNPLTIPPMFYSAYKLGAFLMGIPLEPIDFSLSLDWLSHMIGNSWQPLLLGCLVMATLSSLVGYITIRLLWRLHIIQRWQNRKQSKKESIH